MFIFRLLQYTGGSLSDKNLRHITRELEKTIQENAEAIRTYVSFASFRTHWYMASYVRPM